MGRLVVGRAGEDAALEVYLASGFELVAHTCTSACLW